MITVTCRTFISRSRNRSGELTQPNGKWVLFDPDAVAEKILDPMLVPIIKEACAAIRKIDDDFIASRPGEFIDEDGCRWRRMAE